MEATVERFESGGLPVRLAVRGASADLPPEVVAIVSRVLGEALANVARHARAQRAFVDVRCEGERLELRVEDDGIGFDLVHGGGSRRGPLRPAHHARARAFRRWNLRVGPRPGGGTRVVLRIPIR